jgi:hypothetical protein
VPHISLVFREMLGYQCSLPLILDSSDGLSGQHQWCPYLAKNE